MKACEIHFVHNSNHVCYQLFQISHKARWIICEAMFRGVCVVDEFETDLLYHNDRLAPFPNIAWLNQHFSFGMDIFVVKLTFEMLTVRRQQHSFSTYEGMFLWECRSFIDRKCLDLRGTRNPNLQISFNIDEHSQHCQHSKCQDILPHLVGTLQDKAVLECATFLLCDLISFLSTVANTNVFEFRIRSNYL